ncbi:nucleoside-diphosphate kinase [Streptomyces sp. NPDC050617]|uniref:nucleoside-diphosphate kinase n=1 Tax=Streptomyces sp. NPDC050617 TaxID=3154628 RepID=UPI003423DD19
MPYSLLMVKPDGMRRPEVLADIEEELASSAVMVCRTVDTRLTRERARTLFPSFDEVRYPLTRALLLSYMTSGPVRIMVLSGVDALGDGRRIRRVVRKRHAVAGLANCLHAAADSAEAAAQLAWLAEEHGAPAQWSRDTGSIPASAPVDLVPGVEGDLAKADFDALGSTVWARLEEVGWDGLWSWPTRRGEWGVSLVSDDAHSLDYAASALYEEHPRLPPERTLEAVLRVDQAGSATVFAGARPQAQALADRLTRRGLRVAVAPGG